MMKNGFYILVILIVASCSQSLKKFKFNEDGQNVTLELFSDSTFVENIEVESYEFRGVWTGSFKEGNRFVTKANYIGRKEMILNPERTFLVKDERPILDSLWIYGWDKLVEEDKEKELMDAIENEKIGVMLEKINFFDNKNRLSKKRKLIGK